MGALLLTGEAAGYDGPRPPLRLGETQRPPMLERLLTVDDFEAAAATVLPRMAYDYYRSGADDQRTLRENRRAFRRWEIWYRVLVDVAGDLPRRRVGATLCFESADVAVEFGGAVAESPNPTPIDI